MGAQAHVGSNPTPSAPMTNMFKATKAKSVTQYLADVPEKHRETIQFLHRLIPKTAPSLKPHFAYNMLGYGSFKYTNYKKEVIDWPVVALASQKNYISLYICAVADGKYIAEKYKAKLGNVSVGKSCIRFKKLDDLNISELKRVVKLAARSPGLSNQESRP